MKIQQIRNATILVFVAGKKLIIDPWFEEKGTGAAAPSPNPKQNVPSPTSDLPFTVEEIMKDVDGIIVTHIHPDHFEPKTAAMLDKSIPVFVQDENDKKITEQFGYTNVSILNKDGNKFGDITFFRTEAMHGLSPERTAGNACGVVISVPDEKSLYIAGDTVWYDGVYNALEKYHPDIVVVNACAAELDGVGRLIMDADDVVKVCNAAPYATVIASHMEAVNHAMLNRKTLKEYLEKHNLHGQVLIPDDGEMMSF